MNFYRTIKLYLALGVTEGQVARILAACPSGTTPHELAGLLDPCVPLSVYKDNEDKPIKELV